MLQPLKQISNICSGEPLQFKKCRWPCLGLSELRLQKEVSNFALCCRSEMYVSLAGLGGGLRWSFAPQQ